MHTAQFIWTDAAGEGRNVFALFRRKLSLPSVPSRAEIHLFADTTYRLRVNGSVVHYGPSRFIPSHPEFDTIDITGHLVPGHNEILVEANSKGCSNYQSMPSIGGFIAWGLIGGEDLRTPGIWEACAPRAWVREAECFSFAQGAIEICDLRLFAPDAQHWFTPVPLAHQNHWGPLAPR